MSLTTTTVVTKQVTSGGASTVVTTGSRDWNTRLCSCMDDCNSCLCGMFCLLCLATKVSTRLGEHCCVPCCAGVLPLRIKTRLVLGIQGSICNDICVSACCLPLALCQISRELDAAGWPK